jgi:hypothetical protein
VVEGNERRGKMNRGCVAVGEIKCNNCKRLIEAGQRYMIVEEEEGKKFDYCTECAVAKGYAYYMKEKGEEVLTFFPIIVEPPKPPEAELVGQGEPEEKEVKEVEEVKEQKTKTKDKK